MCSNRPICHYFTLTCLPVQIWQPYSFSYNFIFLKGLWGIRAYITSIAKRTLRHTEIGRYIRKACISHSPNNGQIVPYLIRTATTMIAVFTCTWHGVLYWQYLVDLSCGYTKSVTHYFSSSVSITWSTFSLVSHRMDASGPLLSGIEWVWYNSLSLVDFLSDRLLNDQRIYTIGKIKISSWLVLLREHCHNLLLCKFPEWGFFWIDCLKCGGILWIGFVNSTWDIISVHNHHK